MSTNNDEQRSAESAEIAGRVETEVDLLIFSSTEIDREHGDEVACAVRIKIEEEHLSAHAA